MMGDKRIEYALGVRGKVSEVAEIGEDSEARGARVFLGTKSDARIGRGGKGILIENQPK